jgi:hypothetical protein
MNLALSEVLNLVRKWQNAATNVRGTVMLDTHDCVTQFGGRVSVQGDGITVGNEGGCETALVLRSDMTFAYVDGMLRINGRGWYCTLYEEKVKNLVRLA